MRPATRFAVVAVGDPSRRDAGVGHAVLCRLRERAVQRPFPPGTVLAECDLDPGRLIRLWDHTDLTVVIEAAHTLPSHPGRIHRLEPDVRRPARPQALGPRGLDQAVEVAWELDRLPGRLVAYAVEAADTSLGPGLSPRVAAAVDTLVARVEDEIVRHRVAAARGTTAPATA
ncbi:hydrogenase maturation protease [Streptomyces sp. NK08204]|uniref:hydrogenase maturation protease n=1 Tax=Streptomyces sp. NK08204 TaxID=2873260 RepID=UPI001CEC21CD|nr:hydrogenase maturation protease [Streptomyces sp. NK08204]